MMAGVVLTAVYMTRQMIYVFGGSRRAGAGEAHESPSVMTIPLIVLAISTVVLGVILTPGWPWLHGYLMGEPAHVDFSRIIQPMLFISFALVAAGIALGWFIYRHTGETDPLAQRQPGVFRFLECKMWLDELYAQTVVAGAHGAARVSDWMDRHFWDRIAGVVGSGGDLAGSLTKGLDERGINAGGDTASTGTRGFGRVISLFHSGQVQTYLAAVAISMLALVFLFAWLR
jgi:NADH-quinone oxidoreductase subunit L